MDLTRFKAWERSNPEFPTKKIYINDEKLCEIEKKMVKKKDTGDG